MFQYAFVEALRAHGREVGGSLGFYRKHLECMPFCLIDVFPQISLNEIGDDIFNEIDLKWNEIKKDKKKLADFKRDIPNRFFWVEESDEVGCYNEKVFQTYNCTFVGYWQTERYFRNIEDKLRKIYTFESISRALGEFAKQLKDNYYSVHVRRNDYLNCSIYENICTEEYYMKAMKYIYTQNSKAKFIFFSDDIEWVYQNMYIEKAIYVTKNMFDNYKDWYDMYLMSQCCGNIIANSTFSWWGAWLNQNPEKIVIAPKKWIIGQDTLDIWCESWIKM